MLDMEEISGLVHEQGKAFDEFRKRYDTSLADERKEREALELRLNRQRLQTGGGQKSAAEPERKALGKFARTGDDTELKAMSVGIDPAGGYLVTTAMADAIRTKVRVVSPIASLARTVTIGKADAWEEPFDSGDMTASWPGETDARPAETTPTLAKLRVPLNELTTSQTVTQKLLDTSDYDLGRWLEDRIANKFARSEGAAFVNGTGVNQPFGYLAGTAVATGDTSRTSGVLQYIPTGTSGAFGSTNPADPLLTMVYTLRAPFRANAAFLMNSLSAGTVRKLKDAEGRYLWSDSIAQGQPPLLLGYPVYFDEEMPDIAANTLSIAFGDFAQGYVIVEQPGIKMLQDPYSSKPNVIFYAYRRVGGGICDSDAIKLLKFSVS